MLNKETPNEGNNTVTQKRRSVECMMAVEIMTIGALTS